MRTRGCIAERKRPFEDCLNEDIMDKAGRLIQVLQDVPLLFPDNDMSSSGQSHTAILTTTHGRTPKLIKSDYVMGIDGCFIA